MNKWTDTCTPNLPMLMQVQQKSMSCSKRNSKQPDKLVQIVCMHRPVWDFTLHMMQKGSLRTLGKMQALISLHISVNNHTIFRSDHTGMHAHLELHCSHMA